MNKISKSVILCAGKGKRMGDLTKETPKPMLQVNGVPVLEIIIKGLVKSGVSDILLIVGYQKEMIIDYFIDGSKFGCNITYEIQVEQNGTGKVVELAKNFINDEHFILTYGDILVSYKVYDQLIECGQEDTKVSVKINEDVSKGGAVFIKEGKIIGIIEKPGPNDKKSPYYNAGIYTFSPKIFDYTSNLELSPRGEYELTDAIIAQINDGLDVTSLDIKGNWVDVRDEEILKDLNNSKV